MFCIPNTRKFLRSLLENVIHFGACLSTGFTVDLPTSHWCETLPSGSTGLLTVNYVSLFWGSFPPTKVHHFFWIWSNGSPSQLLLGYSLGLHLLATSIVTHLCILFNFLNREMFSQIFVPHIWVVMSYKFN